MRATAGRGLMAPLGSFSGALGALKPHLHAPRVRFQSFGPRQRRDRRRQLAQRGLAQLLHGDHFQIVGDARVRRAAAPPRWSAARDSVRTRNRPPPPGLYGPTNTLPACCTPGSSEASGMLRCSGAKRLEISSASSTERTRMIAEFLAIDFTATPAVGSAGQLTLHFLGHRERQALRRGQQDRRRIHIVLRLRQHVGGDNAADRHRRR